MDDQYFTNGQCGFSKGAMLTIDWAAPAMFRANFTLHNRIGPNVGPWMGLQSCCKCSPHKHIIGMHDSSFVQCLCKLPDPLPNHSWSAKQRCQIGLGVMVW